MKLESRVLVPEPADTLLLSRLEEFDTLRPSRMVEDPKQEEMVLADVVAVDAGDIEMMVDWDEARLHSLALSSAI